MGILLPASNGYMHERAKWETLPVKEGDSMIMPLTREEGGVGPYTYQPYPAMLYKAGRPTGTSVEITGSQKAETEGAARLLEGQGWCRTPLEAIQRVHDQDQELAIMAANRNAQDRWMGEQAKAESQAVETQSSQHLGEIPRTPIKKRGRPVKVAATT
jgi:hypothetical protein